MYHTRTSFLESQRQSCSACATRRDQEFHSYAMHWTHRIPSHMQEHTRHFQCARDAKMWKRTKKDVKQAWCDANMVVNSTDNTLEGRPSGRDDSPTAFIYYTLTCSTTYTPSTCWHTCKMAHTHTQRNEMQSWCVFLLLEASWNQHPITHYKALSSRAQLRWGKWVVVFH